MLNIDGEADRLNEDPGHILSSSVDYEWKHGQTLLNQFNISTHSVLNTFARGIPALADERVNAAEPKEEACCSPRRRAARANSSVER